MESECIFQQEMEYQNPTTVEESSNGKPNTQGIMVNISSEISTADSLTHPLPTNEQIITHDSNMEIIATKVS